MAETDCRKEKTVRLRREHPKFTYEGFTLERLPDALKVRFHYVLAPGIVFAPETVVTGIGNSAIDAVGDAVLRNLVFHIGLVEMLSYWKAACSPRIVIRAGHLNDDQLAWFRQLLLDGMGEYFYVNGIDFRSPDFVDISAERCGGSGAPGEHAPAFPSHQNLLLLSGGKDSSLAVQLLREAGDDFRCLLLNPTKAAQAIGVAAGCLDPVIINRTIDPRLLELNGTGYLNGHTPFSALLAFWGVACAVLSGCGNVIVANERSADEGNVEFMGRMINHQYTKSFPFESAFRGYASQYLAEGVSYFSLLRPLYDLQISLLFSRYPQYFTSFKSCNRNQKENSWCGKCPKCVSTFIGLYPFLEIADILRIFGRDIYTDETVMPIVRDLVGMGTHKPFECVGTKNETVAALYLAIEKVGGNRGVLPTILRRVESEIFPSFSDIPRLVEQMLSSWSDDHRVPDRYVKLLKERLGRFS